MKILRFNDDRVGALKGGDKVVDLSDTIQYRIEKGPQRVIEEVIENFDARRVEYEQIVAREAGVPLSSVKLLVPVPRPSKCLAAFSNYKDSPDRDPSTMHNEFFHKAPELLGPEGTVELLDIPPVVVFQPEAELAYVIGKQAKNVKEADALNYVFGYVPFVDISARGMLRRSQFVPKGQDTYGPCGPWITTKDEVAAPHDLNVKSWVNGKPRQDYNTKDMVHSIPDQIAWLSKHIQLQPGDVITTGTFHVGLGPINDGDVFEIEVVNLGKARFFIKSQGPRKDNEWLPGTSQPSKPTVGGMHKV
jgi:2-keto-4-pentenoate hydratase/2-oxohepta-3-ene-1,7-dioic acid hydratase in catechol pathway